MPPFTGRLRSPAVVAALLVLPFAILEAISSGSIASLPFPLFATLWLLAVTFIVTLRSLVRSARVAAVYSHLAKLVLMLFSAVVWVSIVLDQMPCFLGVPNCD